MTVNIIWPDDLDDETDRAMIASLLDIEHFEGRTLAVGFAMMLVGFVDDEGGWSYRIYRPTAEARLSEILGYLEIAKAEMIEQHHAEHDD